MGVMSRTESLRSLPWHLAKLTIPARLPNGAEGEGRTPGAGRLSPDLDLRRSCSSSRMSGS